MKGLRALAPSLLLSMGLTSVAATQSQSPQPAVEKVLGIGGLFFRARNPVVLGQWYAKHLGVALAPSSYDEQPWHQAAGPTVFAPFPKTTEYFGRRNQMWMVNFRVRDLDAMIAQLRGAGIEVKPDPKLYPNGRFARLHDPEGNPIELWQPKDDG